MIMDPLVKYYVRQAGGGEGDNGVGLIYISPRFVQHGHVISSFCVDYFGQLVPYSGQVQKGLVKQH